MMETATAADDRRQALDSSAPDNNDDDDDAFKDGDDWDGPTASKLQLSLDQLIEQQHHHQQQNGVVPSQRIIPRRGRVGPPVRGAAAADQHHHHHHPRPLFSPPPRFFPGPRLLYPPRGGGGGGGGGRLPPPPTTTTNSVVADPYGLPPPPPLLPGRSHPYLLPFPALAAEGLKNSNNVQVIAQLLLQQQRQLRRVLALAGLPAEELGQQPGGPRPRVRNRVDATQAAELSALGDMELLYPVMVKAPDSEELVPSPDVALIVRFKGTDVVTVRKGRGEIVLNSGGWRTLSTRLVINHALKPLGFWVEESPIARDTEGSPLADTSMEPQRSMEPQQAKEPLSWRVVDGKSFLAAFSDGMIIGSVGASGRSRLLARASVISQHLKQIKSNALAKRVGSAKRSTL